VRLELAARGSGVEVGSYETSYGYNWTWLGNGNVPGAWTRALAEVEYPSNTIVLGDGSGPAAGGYLVHPYNSLYPPSDRHNDGGNVVMVDGHAKWYQHSNIYQQDVTSGDHVDLYRHDR
jgi:prepilin-type processing-associated H-X9-DG protein